MMIQFSNATAYRHYTIIRSYIFEAIANAHSHSATVSLEGCILSLRVHPGHAIARTSSQCNISFERPLGFFWFPFRNPRAHNTKAIGPHNAKFHKVLLVFSVSVHLNIDDTLSYTSHLYVYIACCLHVEQMLEELIKETEINMANAVKFPGCGEVLGSAGGGVGSVCVCVCVCVCLGRLACIDAT